MTRYYIVCDEENPVDMLELVKIEEGDDLDHKVAELFVETSDDFKEYIDDMVVNGGILERFFRDEKGNLNNESGSRRDDFRFMSQDKFDDYAESCVEANVREFFVEQPIYADLYMTRLRSETYDTGESIEFPEEMYIYTFKKIRDEYASLIIKEVHVE